MRYINIEYKFSRATKYTLTQATKYTLTQKAIEKSNVILSSVTEDNADKELIAITKMIFERFKAKEPFSILALKIRPYLTNNKLPKFIRFEDGVIETLVETGLCDNVARYSLSK